MPIYVYLNPNITGYLLSPILEYQYSLEGANDTKDYAAIDIGTVLYLSAISLLSTNIP